MATTSGRVRAPTGTTEKHLFAGQPFCAYPGCTVRSVDLNDGDRPIIVTEIAHILPASRTGPRFDETLDYEDPLVVDMLRSFDNLVLLCGRHHTLVDSNIEKYTPDVLRGWKAEATVEDVDVTPEQPLPKWWKLVATLVASTLGAGAVIAFIGGGTTHPFWLPACSLVIGLGLTVAQVALTASSSPITKGPPLALLKVGAAVAIVGGFVIAFFLAPSGDPVQQMTAGTQNLAVFPFDGEDDSRTISGNLTRAATEVLPAWNIQGPDWVDEQFPDSINDVESLLASRRVHVALFGTQDQLSLSAWLTGDAPGAALAGVVGPIELCCAGLDVPSNLSPLRKGEVLARQVTDWVMLADFLEALHSVQVIDCAAIEDCVNADTQIHQAVNEFLAPLNDRRDVSSEIQHLARGFIGSTALLRRQFNDPNSDVVEQRDAQLLGGARIMFQSIVASDDATDATRARAFIGLAQTELEESGCAAESATSAKFDTARQHAAAARQLVPPESQPDPSELRVRVGLADANIHWCEWSAGVADADAAIEALSDAISEFGYPDDPTQGRITVRVLVASAYRLRATVLAAEGRAGADADFATAIELAPPLFQFEWQRQYDEYLTGANS